MIRQLGVLSSETYGLFNLTHWFNPDMVWMGVMHIPLLVVPLVALLMPVLERDTEHEV